MKWILTSYYTKMLKSHQGLEDDQYAIHGQTCNNALWNKLLFSDLSRQTLTPGIMTVGLVSSTGVGAM
jgi:hypothetical protein